MEKKKTRTTRSIRRMAVFSVLLLGSLIPVFLAGCAGIQLGTRRGAVVEDWQTVILYGNEDADDLKILKDRLAHTVGEGAYRLTEAGTAFELSVRPTALYNCSVEDYLEYFLTETEEYCLAYRPGSDENASSFVYHTLASTTELEGFGVEIGAADNPAGDESETGDLSETGNEAESEEQSEPETVPGSVEASESGEETEPETDLPVLSFAGKESGRIQFSFPEAIASEIREHLDAGDEVYFMKNRTFPKYSTNNLSQEGWRIHVDETDANLCYSIYDDQDIAYGNEEALKYVLTHEHLKNPYNYILTDDIIWEDAAADDLRGEFQGGPEEQKDDSCLLLIRLAGYRSRPTKGEVAEAEVFLRRRLDLLQSPYAMGTTENGEICVRIAPDHLNAGIVNAILSDDAVRLSDSYTSIYPSNATFRRGPEGQSLEVFPDGTMMQSLRACLNAAPENTENTAAPEPGQEGGETGTRNLYLMIGTLPVARTEVSVPFSDTSLVFSDFCFAGEDRMAEEIDWFTAFAEEMCRNPKLPVSMSLHYVCFGEDRYNDMSGYGLDDPAVCRTEEWEAAVKKICPDAEFRVSPENYSALRVDLHLPDDDQLVENIFAKGREIYEALSFEKSWFRSLNIYPYTWEEEERAGLFFSKDADSDTGAEQVTFYGILFNGRMEKYREDLDEAIEKDDWYVGFPEGTYNKERWWR